MVVSEDRGQQLAAVQQALEFLAPEIRMISAARGVGHNSCRMNRVLCIIMYPRHRKDQRYEVHM